MQYTWNTISYKVEEQTKKIFKVPGHQGLVMAMEVYVITLWLNAPSIKPYT